MAGNSNIALTRSNAPELQSSCYEYDNGGLEDDVYCYFENIYDGSITSDNTMVLEAQV